MQPEKTTEFDMTIVFNPFSIPVILTAIMCILLVIFVIKRRNTYTAGYLLALLILVIVWCTAYALELCFIHAQYKLFTVIFQYISIPSIPVLFALFAYRYANPLAEKKYYITVLLFVVPVITTLLMCTNSFHHFMYSSWDVINMPGTLYTFLVPEYGLGFIIFITYSYAVMVTVFSYIIYISIKTTRLFASQATLLIICSIIPIIANIMNVFNRNIYLDITPVSMLFSAGIMTYLITGMKLLDLQPLARDIIIEKMHDGIVLLDSKNNILDLNPMAETILNIEKPKVMGKNCSVLPGIPLDIDKDGSSDLKLNNKDYNISTLTLSNDTGAYFGRIISMRDISKATLAERKIKDLAFHDSLTNLPNNTYMLQELEKILQEKDQNLALLLIDICNISHINSSYGYETGDALIKKAADLIRLYVWEPDIFARMNGDEFIIVMKLANRDEVAQHAQKIIRLFSHPVIIDDKYISTLVNIGICLSPKDGIEASGLIQKASLALGQAKKNKTHFAFYTEENEQEITQRNRLLNALRTALENGEFSLNYQPQYNSEENSLFGVEALLRWTHPEYGKVPPEVFISLLEDSGIIIPVGNWVISETARQFKTWQSMGLKIPKFSINLSVRQFDNDELIPHILHTLDNEGIPRNCLEVEVTETLAALADSGVVSKIRELSNSGVRIAIDDFGSGFSSLTYFKYISVSTLKVDKEISMDIHKNIHSSVIFKSLKLICDSLGVDIITEYVETVEQIEKLESLGCRNFQGFYYSKPLSSEDFEKYVSSLA